MIMCLEWRNRHTAVEKASSCFSTNAIMAIMASVEGKVEKSNFLVAILFSLATIIASVDIWLLMKPSHYRINKVLFYDDPGSCWTSCLS